MQYLGGVDWDANNILLENIERIEVVRGPGGTLWGANAVNGIINIITKSAKKTQGGFVKAGGGLEERGFGGIRYGGKVGKDVYYRVYAKYFFRDNFETPPGGTTAHDQWQSPRGGFRLDWDLAERDTLTVSLDGHYGRVHNAWRDVDLTRATFSQDTNSEDNLYGVSLLTRWEHAFRNGQDLSLQLYYNRTQRNLLILNRRDDTVDLDFQHSFPLGSRQNMTWGGGYRFIDDQLDGTFTLSFDPPNVTQHNISGFVQDEITIAEKFFVTVGTKLMRNHFSGFEYQPSGRFLWKPHDNHSVWGAVTRAVRTPNRNDLHLRLNFVAFPTGTGTTVLSARGNTNFVPEEVISGELGYRVQPWERLFLDIAAFYNSYDNINSQVAGTASFETSPAAHTNVSRINNNAMDAKSYGVEVATNWDIFDWWRIKPGFTWLQLDLTPDGTDAFSFEGRIEGMSPQFQGHIHSHWNLPYHLEFDTALYSVGELDGDATSTQAAIGRYVRLDVRLGWRPMKMLEVSVIGQNLIESQHAEFDDFFARVTPTQVPRTIFGKVEWKF